MAICRVRVKAPDGVKIKAKVKARGSEGINQRDKAVAGDWEVASHRVLTHETSANSTT